MYHYFCSDPDCIKHVFCAELRYLQLRNLYRFKIHVLSFAVLFFQSQITSPVIKLPSPVISLLVSFFICCVNMNVYPYSKFSPLYRSSGSWQVVVLYMRVCLVVLSLLMSNSVCVQNEDKRQVEDTALLCSHTRAHKRAQVVVITTSYLASTMLRLIWRKTETRRYICDSWLCWG